MNASEQPSRRGASRPIGGCILSCLALLLVIGQIVFSVVTYPLLPDIVPSHWDAAGQVNGTMSKLGFLMTFVGISLGMFIVFQGISFVVKHVDQTEKQMGSTIVSALTFLPLIISFVTQLITTGVILHWH